MFDMVALLAPPVPRECRDRGYVLDQGKDAYTGTGRELANDPKVIQLYLGTLAEDVESERAELKAE